MSNSSTGASPAFQPDPVIGSPETDVTHSSAQQGYADTCAIRCEAYILEIYQKTDIPEDTLVAEAKQNGWYTPGGGADSGDMGNLLEAHGIAVNRYQDATIYDLANELGKGHKVIAGVESGEGRQQHPILESIAKFFGINSADLAVVVAGIDTSDPAQTQVIVSNPGSGEAAAHYPLDRFLDAWKDSDFFMVATQEPAPPDLPEMLNFDYGAGHIDSVNGIAWEDFVALEPYPEQWDLLTPEDGGAVLHGPDGQIEHADTAPPDFHHPDDGCLDDNPFLSADMHDPNDGCWEDPSDPGVTEQ